MEDLKKLSLEAACGNAAAAAFLTMMVEALHLWDDLIDKDHERSDEDINRVFTTLMVDLPTNPFFQQHAFRLTGVLMVAIQNWKLSTDVERKLGDDDLAPEAAFILRSSYVDLVGIVATICGGWDHGLYVAHRVHALAHREGFSTYLNNVDIEAALRGAL